MTIFSNKALPFVFLNLLLSLFGAQAKCKTGCHLALASYYVWQGSNLSYISTIFGKQIPEILQYNPDVQNKDSIISDTRIKVPFSCDCLNSDFLGHTFSYDTKTGSTYEKIASDAFANLTTEDWVRRVNIYEPTRIPDNVLINVTVNCSCGDRRVSTDYGLFTTYPLRPGENLSFIAAELGVSPELVQKYNPETNFSAGFGLVYLPAKED